MSNARGRTAEFRIASIAAGGAGVGRDASGRAVFVHRTAPGETVRVRIVEAKKRWARGELLQVIEPVADRRDAPCPFYARCGGCTLEHMAYTAQLEAKRTIVADALERIGGIDIDKPGITASPRELRYRNRVSFTLVRTRGEGVRAGFHLLLKPDTVLDIDETCLLPEEPIALAWGELRRAWGPSASRLPSGEKLRLTLRATNAGRTSLLVQGGYASGKPDELIERVTSLDSVWHQPQAHHPAQRIGGAAELSETWSDEDVAVGGAVFLQVNRGAAALLEQYVMQIAGDVSGRTIIDAYCGVGMHARRLARLGAVVTGIELDTLALDEARRATPGASFVAGLVEHSLPVLLPADLVILNPPRSGVVDAVTAALTNEPPGRIIYISCDPATLSRDLKKLAGAFTIRSVRCFDLFPQTAHVETVVELQCSIT